MSWHDWITIYGNVPSKSNSYIPIAKGKMIANEAVKQYEKQFRLQAGYYINRNISGYFELELIVYFKKEASDLDGCLKIILDCLQKCNAISNDNRATKITATKRIDKDNPRIEFKIHELSQDT